MVLFIFYVTVYLIHDKSWLFHIFICLGKENEGWITSHDKRNMAWECDLFCDSHGTFCLFHLDCELIPPWAYTYSSTKKLAFVNVCICQPWVEQSSVLWIRNCQDADICTKRADVSVERFDRVANNYKSWWSAQKVLGNQGQKSNLRNLKGFFISKFELRML